MKASDLALRAEAQGANLVGGGPVRSVSLAVSLKRDILTANLASFPNDINSHSPIIAQCLWPRGLDGVFGRDRRKDRISGRHKGRPCCGGSKPDARNPILLAQYSMPVSIHVTSRTTAL